MKIALVQSRMGHDMADNLQKTISAMENAAEASSNVICFPEIQFSPFSPQFPKRDVSMYAIDINHKIVDRLRVTCAKTKLIAIPNFYLEENGNRYDASPVINLDGELLGISKMVHVAQAPYFYEQDYYTPSNSGFHVYDTPAGKIGIVICFDRHFPESVRTCALRGAEIIIVPTANTRVEPMEMFEWEMRISAMQNGGFIAMCNRVGIEDNMDFCGESIVINPNGDIVAKANDQEQILYAEIGIETIEKIRNERPYMRLRRADMYE